MGQKLSKDRRKSADAIPPIASYIHQPFKNNAEQIRLLRIRPGFRTRIELTIEIFNLDQCPPYQALSYTWGSEDDQKGVYLDGEIFIVHKNLYDFLQSYRSLGKGFTKSFSNYKHHITNVTDAYLWIDQLSIDQKNIRERNEQVQLMRQIYQQAEEVVLWLGSGTWKEFTALTEIRNMRYTNDGVAVDILLKNAYWTRLWVVQEMLLARDITIMCGHYTVRWDALDRWFLHHKPKVNYHSADTCANVMNAAVAYRRLGPAHQHEFEDALRNFCGQKCSDVRDKVYGLLGVIQGGDSLHVQYSSSPEDVFNAAVRLMIFCEVEDLSLRALARLREKASAPAVPTLWTLRREMGVQKSDPLQWDEFRQYIDDLWLQELDKRISALES